MQIGSRGNVQTYLFLHLSSNALKIFFAELEATLGVTKLVSIAPLKYQNAELISNNNFQYLRQ